jgi:hypothetical protein
MKKYLLYLMPTTMFFVTLSIGVLKKGTIDPLFEGSYLALFIMGHTRFFRAFLPIMIAICMAAIFPHQLLEITSLSLSAALSVYAFRSFKKQEQESYKNEKLAVFFETLSKDNLEKISGLQEKLDTFLMQQIQEPNIEEADLVFKEPYDESLDLLEDSLKFSMEFKEKKERQPLRRLRRIVMKQTSFLDESGSG